MSWHVLGGKYLMAYGGGAQPNTLYGLTGSGGHTVVIVFDIEYGLVGTNTTTATGEEIHVQVDGSKVVFVGSWKSVDHIFVSGGAGRLYFDATQAHQDLLEPIFNGSSNTPALAAFNTLDTYLQNINLRDSGSSVSITTPGPKEFTATVVATTAGPAVSGTLRLSHMENPLNSQLDCVLMNAAPDFRMGGYTPDFLGATLARVENSEGSSTWTDPIDNMDVSTFGEIREFQYIGAEEGHTLPNTIRNLSWYAHMS